MSETPTERFDRDFGTGKEADRTARELTDETDERLARLYVDGGDSATGESYDPAHDANDDGDLDMATGATAGAPGSWTPSGDKIPSTLAECAGVTASPATAWTTGQHVLLKDGTTKVHWNGTAWTAGQA